MNKLAKLNKEKFIVFCQALALFPLLIDYVISAFCKILGTSTDYLRIIAYVIYAILFFVAIIFSIKKSVRVFPIIFPVIIVSSLLIVASEKKEMFSDFSAYFYTLFIMCIPTYFLFTHKFNTELLYKYMLKFSYVSAIFFSLVYFVNSFIVKIMNTENYQVTSYAFLLPIFFILQKNKKNRFDYFLIIITIALSVFAGGRISIVCIGAFAIIMLLKKGKENFLWTMALIFLIVISIVFFDTFITFVALICEKFSIHGGIADYLSRGDVFSNNSRLVIYEECLELISANHYHGYGVLAERYLITTSIYEHNIILELILHYGLALTILFTIWYVIKAIKLFKHSEDTNLKKIVLSLILSKGLLVLMFSASYLQFTEFFALVAILTHSIGNKNKTEEIGVDYEKK